MNLTVILFAKYLITNLVQLGRNSLETDFELTEILLDQLNTTIHGSFLRFRVLNTLIRIIVPK